MYIREIHACNFKSLHRVQVSACGAMNVLIGRNNAGKSNILSAIRLVVEHLNGGVVAQKLSRSRTADLICDREPSVIAQVGIEFAWSEENNNRIRAILEKDAPQHGKAIAELQAGDAVCAIVALDASGEGVVFLQCLAAGGIREANGQLEASGTTLFSATPEAASQLAARTDELSALVGAMDYLGQVRGWGSEELEMIAEHGRAYLRHRHRPGASRRGIENAHEILAQLAEGAKGKAEMADRIEARVIELKRELDELKGREIDSDLSTFSGVVRSVPPYLSRMMSIVGGLEVLQLGERREPIGRAEADQLLNLKVKRGGAEQLLRVQQTVEALLGVRIDAFRGDERHGQDRAELDVDEFLVDANGAGVREALRLIIDLELKAPDVVLLEEPEVHLHPGLESALEGYLRKKSEACQIFVTTHSTNFVDAVDFQNVYMIRRDSQKHTECISVGGSGDAWQIPAEIGLRLSTLFMFERLVFVEGPSDEAILREFAAKLGADLARAGVGFVHMGGVRNYAHYAARATLDLLAKRNIPMWFIVDRDEREDSEVQAMMDRIGGDAVLVTLERREMENFLLEPEALREHIASIGCLASRELPSIASLKSDINEVAAGLKDSVARLRLSNKLLAPVFPNRVKGDGALVSRLVAAREEITARIDSASVEEERIQNETDQDWERLCTSLAPGSEVLHGVLGRYGSSFNKRRGDALRIARQVKADQIHTSIQQLIRTIADAQ